MGCFMIRLRLLRLFKSELQAQGIKKIYICDAVNMYKSYSPECPQMSLLCNRTGTYVHDRTTLLCCRLCVAVISQLYLASCEI